MAKEMSTQNSVTPSAEGLAASARAVSGRGPAPVHKWSPPFLGDIDIRIARDGTWFHEGTPIAREGLVRLFSSILKREGDAFFLVTPDEKFRIRVDDAPFVATDFDLSGSGEDQALTFHTHTGESVRADAEHPIRVRHDAHSGEPSPYVMVRDGLEALIDRKSFYRLAALACEHERDGRQWFGVWSGGAFFALSEDGPG